jgi:hypothetical protein
MSTLRSSLNELVASFTRELLATIRNASLDELVAESAGGRRALQGRRQTAADGNGRAVSGRAKTGATGRLRRRSAEEIVGVLDGVVALLKKNRAGLRAEQIRAELGLQAKEMPRVLKEGLTTQRLKSKGQKRATTYFAA